MVFHVRPGTSWATLSREARLGGLTLLGTRVYPACGNHALLQ